MFWMHAWRQTYKQARNIETDIHACTDTRRYRHKHTEGYIYIYIYIHTEYAETEMYMHKYMTQTRKHGHMHRDIRRSTWYMETDGRQTDT